MSAPQPVSAAALPAVLSDVAALSFAGSIDTRPLRERPHLFDLGDMDRLVVSGRDRQRFLHAMLSNDVANLDEGQGCWATLNTIQGRTVTDVRLFQVARDRREGTLLALLEPGAAERFTEGLEKYLIAEKVYFEPDVDSFLWLVAGTGAEEAVVAAGAELPPVGILNHRMTRIGATELRVLRLDRLCAKGNDLLLWGPADGEAAVLKALSDLIRGDRSLLEAARIESAHPRFGVDLTEKNIPLEAGLANRAIHFSKGCYIGQEVICRVDSMGTPARRLVQLHAEKTADVPAFGQELVVGSKTVGTVTSAVRSETLDGVVALGYVKKRFNAQGTVLQAGPEGAEFTILGTVGDQENQLS